VLNNYAFAKLLNNVEKQYKDTSPGTAGDLMDHDEKAADALLHVLSRFFCSHRFLTGN